MNDNICGNQSHKWCGTAKIMLQGVIYKSRYAQAHQNKFEGVYSTVIFRVLQNILSKQVSKIILITSLCICVGAVFSVMLACLQLGPQYHKKITFMNMHKIQICDVQQRVELLWCNAFSKRISCCLYNVWRLPEDLNSKLICSVQPNRVWKFYY